MACVVRHPLAAVLIAVTVMTATVAGIQAVGSSHNGARTDDRSEHHVGMPTDRHVGAPGRHPVCRFLAD